MPLHRAIVCVKDDDISILRIEISRLPSRTVPGNAVPRRKLGSAAPQGFKCLASQSALALKSASLIVVPYPSHLFHSLPSAECQPTLLGMPLQERN